MMIRLPNPLASRRGRLAAFFALYVTEGLPQGFAATAVATQMRRMGLGPAEIGAFMALAFVPWALKWMMGPVVDVFRSRRFGHYRAWIVFTQTMMIVTVLALAPIPLRSGIGLFTGVLLIHNVFGAMQDVAIDALAVNTVAEDERGIVNGLMFAGAGAGQVIGGSGVLYLMPVIGYRGTFGMVAAAIAAVTVFVVWPMREPAVALRARAGAGRVLAQMAAFASESFQSFLGSRAAFAGLFFILLPGGAMGLGLTLGSNLAVEVGMSDDQVANLNTVGMLVGAVAVIIGGFLSDRFSRRGSVAIYLALMTPPVLYLALRLQQAGYILPRPGGGAALPEVITAFWVATIVYSIAQGLSYGARIALMMDVTNPRVAGTQFTAYMAMGNLAQVFASSWQGISAEKFGYPATLVVDGLTGLLCILLLPLMRKVDPQSVHGLCDMHAEGRARLMARVLAPCCLAFVPYAWLSDPKNPFAEIAQTLFTLVFVAAALLLYASTLLQMQSRISQRLCKGLAVALLALYARHWLPDLPAVHTACSGVVMLAALTLLRAGARPWSGLAPLSDPVPDMRPRASRVA